MTWRDVYNDLLSKASKEACLAVAISCCNKSVSHAVDSHIPNTLKLIKDNADKKIIDKAIQRIAVIRVQARDNLYIRESAHVMLHAAEVAISNSYQSAAGHASRCIDALSRIDESLAQAVCDEFLNG